MPIVVKKHFGDSDDESNDAINLFLQDTGDIKQPPAKKRKLNTQKSQPTHNASKNSKNKKSKSMLKRLRIKKTKEKNRMKQNKSNKPNKANKANTMILFESMQPLQIANEFQKLFLKTLETSTKELQFQFKPSNFIQISSKDKVGSLDNLHKFLTNYYFSCANITNKINQNDDNENENENKNSLKEWIAYTKSMQILIISPSVRKAVDTIKSLQNIKVEHSFIHKKQLNAMNAEQYDEYKENEQDQQAVHIPLRICELFGKHRKIEYQQKELLNKSWHCGVGGINRINKLFQSKHLTLKKCELIMIDLQRNAKNMCIFDMQQICVQLCGWFKEYAFKHIKNKQTKIAFF